MTDAKYVKALIPAVVNIVYKKLLQYDITARAFQTRSTSFKGPLDDTPTEESPQILHRKLFLRGYLNKLCSDPTKMEFWEYLDKVGYVRESVYGIFAYKVHRMMHVGLGRTHPLHIEYIHLGACLSFIQDIMTEAILSHPKLPLPRKISLVKALGKIIWIQNDLMAKWHIREGVDEFAVNDDDDIEIEAEGYLHGRKIVIELDEEEKDAGTPTDAAPAGVCPFSGVAKGMVDTKIEEHDFAKA